MAGRFAGPPSQRQCVVKFARDYKPLQELQQFRRTLLQNGCILPAFLGIMTKSSPQNSLFTQEPEDGAAAGVRPLADRLRPASLGEVSGQDHLVGPDGTLTRMIARGSLSSLILWGPPGVGKTTIARLLAAAAHLHFVQLSAVFSGVADLKRVFEEAGRRRAAGQVTLLFVDEIHRFNRAQQDGFLAVVEDGTVVLVGATTENPVLRPEWRPVVALPGAGAAPAGRCRAGGIAGAGRSRARRSPCR